MCEAADRKIAKLETRIALLQGELEWRIKDNNELADRIYKATWILNPDLHDHCD